jgi:hypothetical protein
MTVLTAPGITYPVTRRGRPISGGWFEVFVVSSLRRIGKLARASYGPSCLFPVDSSNMLRDRFKSLDERNPLLREIRRRTDGSLAGFRSLATSSVKLR